MQGLTGSQTKSCEFKGLRGERVAGWNESEYAMSIVSYCQCATYALPARFRRFEAKFSMLRRLHVGEQILES